MSRAVPCWGRCWLWAGGLLLLAAPALAQVASPIEPRWMRLTLPQVYTGLEVEGLYEHIDINDNITIHKEYSIVPLVGLRTSGSIYHPNLLSFDFDGEGGWGWLRDSYSSPGEVNSRDQDEALRRCLLNVNLLSSKPYNATFVASHDHTFQNYDVFNTYEVDSTRRGGLARWMSGNVELNVDTGYRDETSVGLYDVSQIVEHYLNFNGNHKRAYGQTTLIYRYDAFDNSYNYGPSQDSVNQTVSLSDTETFGSHRQGTATAGASYSHYFFSGQPSDTVAADGSVTFQHTPNLESFLTLHYSYSSLDPVTTDLFQGTAGVRHQLYESLTSIVDVHGSDDSASSPYSSAANSRYGLGLAENYNKKLSQWGHLTLGGAIIADHEDHESSGSVQTTIDERHVLYLLTSTNYQPAFLIQPRVLTSTIEVRGPNGIPAIENVDYRVIPIGERIEIRLMDLAVNLHSGDQVFVNYLSESLYNAAFESLNSLVQIRLDLFNLVGLYGRFNWVDNNAPPSALAESLTDLVGGAEFYWRWFRTGGEYETYDSNFSQYKSWRLFQSVSWQPTAASTLGVDFSETFYSYPGGLDQTRYQALARYHTQLTYALAWYAEGGYSFQNVVGAEQNLGAARTGLNWVWGKLNFRTGYQYNYQTTDTGGSHEKRDRNYFFAYLRRSF